MVDRFGNVWDLNATPEGGEKYTRYWVDGMSNGNPVK